MIKKKSRTLAFLLAASLIMPTVDGTVLAAANEESGVIQEVSEVSNEANNTEDSNSTETPESKPIFESGDGTQTTPYIINSLEQLKAFRDSVNAGNTYAGKHIKLIANVDLSGENWEPIGRGDKPFKGKFDGGSKEGVVVSNLKIEKGLSNTASNSYVGLFGYLTDSAKLENLTIENAKVKGSLYVGVAVGRFYTGEKISNVTVKGDIQIDGYWYLGGISGRGEYINLIENSRVEANKGSYINGTGSYIGGINGFRGEGSNNIVNCSVKNLKITGIDRLGGISGIAHYGNTISNCTVKDTIIKSDKYNDNADTVGTIAGANLAGENVVKILDCNVENTFAYLYNSDKPLTQKISMLNHEGKELTSKVIVGNNVKEEKGKVIDGEFEILTSDMYDDKTLKLGDIGNDRYILVPIDTVAMVGKTPYNSFDSAISASKENDTIRLIEDLKIDSPIDLSGKNSRTIDFNSKKIMPTEKFTGDSLITISNTTGLKLIEGNFDTGKEVKNAVVIKESDKIVVEDVVIDKTNSNDKGSAIVIENSKVDIEGKLDVNGNKDNTTAGIEVIGANSIITIKIDSDIETENQIPEIIFKGGASEEDSLVDENKEPEKPSVPSTPSKPIHPTYDHTSIIGSDRYETAGKIADKLGSYDTAVLVNATSTMSDGLSAAGLAGKEDAAILLVKKDSIPKATMDRLSKVKKVYIIGGENAISQKVVNQLKKNNVKVNVERLGGKTRVETSELVAKEIGSYKKAFVVNGFKGEADAMSASSVAAREEAPILLTNGKSSSTDRKSGVTYYVVGGKSVMNDSIVKKYKAERIAGDDRYETNREMVNEFYGASETLYFANGETLVDALTASTISKDDGLVLVGRKSDNKILNKKNTIQVGGMKFDVDFEK